MPIVSTVTGAALALANEHTHPHIPLVFFALQLV